MLIEITDINDSRVAPYVSLTGKQLMNRLNLEEGLFIAESPKVIDVALNAGFKPVSLLTEMKHVNGDAKDIIQSVGDDVPVYTGRRELLAQLTGYTLTRGVLCAMRRPIARAVDDVLEGARRVVMIDGVVDATNVGAIFRNAAALGMDAVLVTEKSCSPWNRRAIRVSMGSVFLLPWTTIGGITDDLTITDVMHRHGFRTCAMALVERSIGIDVPELKSEEKLAIILGSEGYGLERETIESCDYVVRIPMYHNVDSLNVAAASAVAFYELMRK